MEKLIRDNLPNIPHKEYTSMNLRYVRDTAEHILFLLAKLDEEMDEFGGADQEGKIHEAGDVLEVLEVLLSLYDTRENIQEYRKIQMIRSQFEESCRTIYALSLREIRKYQNKKRMEKGSFKNGTVWIYEIEK